MLKKETDFFQRDNPQCIPCFLLKGLGFDTGDLNQSQEFQDTDRDKDKLLVYSLETTNVVPPLKNKRNLNQIEVVDVS